jgi:hypothetical protein
MRTNQHVSPALLILGAAILAPSCGDLSNEDLEFQAVLPDSTLNFALPPSQANTTSSALSGSDDLGAVDASSQTATRLDTVASGIVARVRSLSSHSPTKRTKTSRMWGPFYVPGFNGFHRLTIEKDPTVTCDVAGAPIESTASGYHWAIESSLSRSGPFQTLDEGTVRGLDFGHSCGTVNFETNVSRYLGEPQTDDDPNAVQLAWTKAPATGLTITANVQPSNSGVGPLDENVTYDYAQLANEYGHFNFAFRYTVVDRINPVHIFAAALKWGPRGSPWRADSDIQIPDGTKLTHGLACGAPWPFATFSKYGVLPSVAIDSSSDPNCSFDYSPAGA